MNTQALSHSLKIVKNPFILVNMVSQRVRQLGQGHKALVPVEAKWSYMDVALKEIADGKLSFEMEEAELVQEASKGKSKRKK